MNILTADNADGRRCRIFFTTDFTDGHGWEGIFLGGPWERLSRYQVIESFQYRLRGGPGLEFRLTSGSPSSSTDTLTHTSSNPCLPAMLRIALQAGCGKKHSL